MSLDPYLLSEVDYPDKFSAVITLQDVVANLPGAGEGIGELFWATDTKELYRWSGSAWELVGGATYSGAQRIQTSTISGGLPTSYTDFSWITGTNTWDTDTYFVTGLAVTAPADGYYRVDLNINTFRWPSASSGAFTYIKFAVFNSSDVEQTTKSREICAKDDNSIPTKFYESITFNLNAGDYVKAQYKGEATDGVSWGFRLFTIERLG